MKIIGLIMASAAAVMKIAKIMAITSAITGETTAIKMAAMAGGMEKKKHADNYLDDSGL